MGRKRQVKTPEELEAQKKKWWGPERNARRRERYANDPKYREKAITQVRDSYKATRKREGFLVRGDDCRLNLGRLHEIGMVRTTDLDGTHQVRRLTFTFEELAKLLERNPQVISRWVKEGLLPAPCFQARKESNRMAKVFTVPEVRAIAEVFGEHQQSSQYYRGFHEETRAKLFAKVDAARQEVTRSIGTEND